MYVLIFVSQYIEGAYFGATIDEIELAARQAFKLVSKRLSGNHCNPQREMILRNYIEC